MKIFLFIFCYTTLAYEGMTQNWDWAKNIDMNAQEVGYSLGSDNQGNFYVSGSTHYSTGGGGSYYYGTFWKLDKNGMLLWLDTLFGNNRLTTDSNGFSYVAGSKISKYNSTGQNIWIQNAPFAISGFQNVVLHPLYGIISIGYALINGNTQGFISRYDANGNCLWTNMGSFPAGGSTPITITCDNVGNVFVAGGGYQDSATGNSGFLAKFDNNGILVFYQVIPQTPSDIAVDAHNNIYVAGWYSAQPININGTVYSANNIPHQYLIKYDSHGNLLWYKILSGYLQTGSSIALGADDNIYYTSSYYHLNMTIDSYTLTGHTSVEAFVFMADSLGNIKWLTTTSGSSNSLGNLATRDILVNKTGDIFITGEISGIHSFGSTIINANDYSDVLIAKLSQPDVSFISPTETKNAVFTIYPNPSSGIFTINYSSQEKGSLEIKITNVKGQTIFTETISHFTGEYTKDIDLSKHAKGIYFVEIIADRKRTIRKIVLD